MVIVLVYHLQITRKVTPSFSLGPQVKKACPSLHLSKKYQLQDIWKGFFAKHFLKGSWNY